MPNFLCCIRMILCITQLSYFSDLMSDLHTLEEERYILAYSCRDFSPWFFHSKIESSWQKCWGKGVQFMVGETQNRDPCQRGIVKGPGIVPEILLPWPTQVHPEVHFTNLTKEHTRQPSWHNQIEPPDSTQL